MSGTFCAILVEGITRNNSVKLFEFGPVVQEISFKDFKSRAIHTIFGRGHYGEHSCEIILNLDMWFRSRCYLKEKFIERTIDGRHMPDEN